MNTNKPKLALPEPINGLDPGSFAHYTLSERLPNIARQVLEDNHWPVQSATAINELAQDMPDGKLGKLPVDESPDQSDWQVWLDPYRSMSWLEAPWFLAETYFFRRLVAASGYFRDGAGKMVDPYARIKQQGLKPVHIGLQRLNEGLQALLFKRDGNEKRLKEALIDLLRMNLWGNKADLSLFPAAGSDQPLPMAEEELSERILVDHAPTVSSYLLEKRDSKVRVDIVLDNGGLELAYDLALADFLLDYGLCEVVYLHAKPFPTYVSDATIADVLAMIDYIDQAQYQAVRGLSERLTQNHQNGCLKIKTDYFWTSPLSGWHLPGNLSRYLSGTSLVISKGDANYRRWLGDLRWPFDTPLDGILNYLHTPLLFLRVFKSNCLAGLEPGQQEEVQSVDTDWLYNGNWGLIQAHLDPKTRIPG